MSLYMGQTKIPDVRIGSGGGPQTAVLYTPQELTAEQQLQAKANISAGDYVTPEMYGAKADGVTDCTQAFRNAINKCISDNLVFYVPKRDDFFIINEPIVISKQNKFKMIMDGSIINTGTDYSFIVQNSSYLYLSISHLYSATGKGILLENTKTANDDIRKQNNCSFFELHLGEVRCDGEALSLKCDKDGIQYGKIFPVTLASNNADTVTFEVMPIVGEETVKWIGEISIFGGVINSKKRGFAGNEISAIRCYGTSFENSIQGISLKNAANCSFYGCRNENAYKTKFDGKISNVMFSGGNAYERDMDLSELISESTSGRPFIEFNEGSGVGSGTAGQVSTPHSKSWIARDGKFYVEPVNGTIDLPSGGSEQAPVELGTFGGVLYRTFTTGEPDGQNYVKLSKYHSNMGCNYFYICSRGTGTNLYDKSGTLIKTLDGKWSYYKVECAGSYGASGEVWTATKIKP